MHDDPTPLVKEYPRADPRLGRRMQLDARSLPYMVERVPAELRRPHRSVHWLRSLPVLNQGELGACVGFSATGLLGTTPWNTLDDVLGLSGYTEPDMAAWASAYAVALYAETTGIDPFDGTYPPDDTGTDGLSVCKVLKNRGLCAGYLHAHTLWGFIRLLQSGPVLMGMPWLSSFYEPNADGFIDCAGWMDGELVGGHEVEITGVQLDHHRPFDRARAVFELTNSWGPEWGLNGRAYFSGALYLELRGDIDLKQPVPLS